MNGQTLMPCLSSENVRFSACVEFHHCQGSPFGIFRREHGFSTSGGDACGMNALASSSEIPKYHASSFSGEVAAVYQFLVAYSCKSLPSPS